MTEDEILAKEVQLGNSAANAKELFVSAYIETRRIQLLQEFISIDVKKSARIFEIKYSLDALLDLERNINYLISSGNAAKIQLTENEQLTQ